MMWRVSGPAESNGRAETVDGDAGVLSNLPRTRPQRSTARRTAARSQNARRASSENGSSGGASSTATARKPRAAAKPAKAAGTAKPAKAAKPRKPAKAKAKAAKATAKPGKRAAAERPRKAAARRPLRVVRDEVPRQGFECDDDRATGAVPPPGSTELVSTAVEIVGELAKAGISGGERLLRDVLGAPRPLTAPVLLAVCGRFPRPPGTPRCFAGTARGDMYTAAHAELP